MIGRWSMFRLGRHWFHQYRAEAKFKGELFIVRKVVTPRIMRQSKADVKRLTEEQAYHEIREAINGSPYARLYEAHP